MVCKTIWDGSNPSVHLRPGVMANTWDFGSCNIGSIPMAAVPIRMQKISGFWIQVQFLFLYLYAFSLPGGHRDKGVEQ